jgi:hypothetical protein
MSAILVLALGLIVCVGRVSEAAPMGTAWTYQGRLMDANAPAEGLYDFQFKLYDDANTVTGNHLGSVIDINDLDVIDGYFTAELDFGSSVFDGNLVWLEIDVRPGDSNDVNDFVTLSPRQEITPTPYALQTRGIFADKSENIGMGTTSPKGKLHVDGGKAKLGFWGTDITIDAQDGGDGGGFGGDDAGDGGDIILLPGEGGEPRGLGRRGRDGKVGIGTTKPNYEFDVVGNINFTGNLYQNGSLFPGGGSLWTVSGSDIYFNAGNVGIGTTNPLYKLQVQKNSGITIYGYTRTGKALFGWSEGSGVGVYGESDIESGYAGYFHGRTYFSGGVGVGTTNPIGQVTLGEYQGGTAGSAVAGHYKQLVLSGEYNTTYNAGSSVKLLISDYDNDTGTDIYPIYCEDEQNRVDFYVRKQEGAVSTAYFGGNVGIGTTVPSGSLYPESTTLEIAGNAPSIVLDDGLGSSQDDFEISNGGDKALFRDATDGLDILTIVLTGTNEGHVGIGTNSPTRKLTVRGNILLENASTGAAVVELGEGLDYSEGFDVTEQTGITPGTVLVIDDENPGKLTVSSSPYDSKVAGIVAGGKGLGSGVRLGVSQFDQDVALAGRVYCKVDATEAGVEPGDLLTTSGTPGHAMKTTDYMRAQGAILGKAMEKLEQGKKGHILVLVTLQ